MSSFQILASPGFPDWLRVNQVSLAFSTYQVGKLFFVGCNDQRISVFERTFNRCMGLWSDTETLWLAAAFQLWRLDNVLAAGSATDDGYDRLFVPSVAITTGDIDVHDIGVQRGDELIFVNTLFSCLATRSDRLSFQPSWRPPFISKLAAEDRCHLNGLACDDGQPKYVTACSQTDRRHGWRDVRTDGGCLIDVASGETVVDKLSMPHSPRIFRQQAWLLDSGHGYFGRVDLDRGRFEPLVFCPGYARGLAFTGRFAVIGLSRPRDDTFHGLPLDEEFKRQKATPRCGLQVIDLESGRTAEWLQIEGVVDELYDVIVLPGVKRPKALGLKTDEIQRNVWFEDEGRTVRWSAGHK